MEFTKVRAGELNVRYIDNDGNWYKKKFNGQLQKSRKMLVDKIYGLVNFKIEDNPTYGKRVIDED